VKCPDLFHWLDWLEAGELDGFERDHLRECRACAARLSELRATAHLRLDPPGERHFGADDDKDHMTAYVSAPPAMGDIWLSSTSHAYNNEYVYDNVDQLMFVVLNENVCEHGQHWCDVAPLVLSTDQASDLDLVLEPEHSTLNMPLVLQPRRQLLIAHEQLDRKIGEVVKDFLDLLQRAVQGDLDARMTGIPYESAFDPRLEDEQYVSDLVERLRAPHALAMQQAEEVVPEAAHSGQLATVIPLIHEFRQAQHHALAAARSAVPDGLFVFDEAHLFEAQLRVDVLSDMLQVRIERLLDEWVNELCLMVRFYGGHVAATPLKPGESVFGPACAHGEGEIEALWLDRCEVADAR
jgi:hypothetical protein